MTKISSAASAMLICAAAAAAAAPPEGGRYALLVGVANYDKGELRPLKYADADAESLAEVLRKDGYARVVLMTQSEAAKSPNRFPSGANIRAQLKGLLAGRGRGDTVLVTFAGHGVQLRGAKEHYFCPIDARLADVKSLISLSEVYDELKACAAATKVLLVDACRNDPQSDLSRDAAETIESVTRPQTKRPPGGVAALFSCSEGQKAYESDELRHGIFFHFVLQGLKGKAAEDGAVDLLGLARYVQRRVPDYVKDDIGPGVDQKPVLISDLNGDAVLAGTAKAKSRPVASFFNGRDLSGWKGDPKLWRVENGAIVGRLPVGDRLPHPTFLFSDKFYKDFDLRFKVRITGGTGNSGVQIRSDVFDAGNYRVRGPQGDMGFFPLKEGGRRNTWGELVTEPSGSPRVKPDERLVEEVVRSADFNDYRVTCIGKHVEINLNGRRVLDTLFDSMPPTGVIAWQLHSWFPGMEVTFKDIVFTDLTPR